MSWWNGSQLTYVESGSLPSFRVTMRALCKRLVCVIRTPLGSPVDPEV
jgi:hypothetical protein